MSKTSDSTCTATVSQEGFEKAFAEARPRFSASFESDADKVLRTEIAQQLREMAALRSQNARLSDRLVAGGFDARSSATSVSGMSARRSSSKLQCSQSQWQNTFGRLETFPASPTVNCRPILAHPPGKIPASLHQNLAWSPRRGSAHWTSVSVTSCSGPVSPRSQRRPQTAAV
ncbi:unnamed protein product [Polarella glacialis]|uniref:Uncharacterized protein n=1 Tax=Polarella glacialis TaxID=89957 RepID=A0A813HSK9_POLGL|nr:unnamed protein product [Polarella glacialis]